MFLTRRRGGRASRAQRGCLVWRTFSLPFVFPSHFSHSAGVKLLFQPADDHIQAVETPSMSPSLVKSVSPVDFTRSPPTSN